MKNHSPCSVCRKTFLALMALLLPLPALAEPVTLKHAVELALKHATTADISAADEQRASAAYRELRNNYVPQLITGAGIGPPSYGFPLGFAGSIPSLFNLNVQSAVLDPSLREFIRAARVDSAVAALRTKDQRN